MEQATASSSLNIHHSHSGGFPDEQKALIANLSHSHSRSRGDNDRMSPLPADRYSSSGRIRVRKGGGDREQVAVSIGRVNSNTSTGNRVGGMGYGIGYGIGASGGIGSSISSIGRSVDENYHLYGSSPDSGYPSPIFIRKHYRSPGESAADLGGVAAKAMARETEATVASGEGGVVFPGDLGDGDGNGEGARIGLSGETVKAGEGFDGLWASVGDSGGHVTTLKGDGPARTGVKRLGSKVSEPVRSLF